MNAWEVYERRMLSRGATKREAALNRESRMLTLKLPDNLSYFTALVDDSPQEVAIIDSDNLNEKLIYSLPGETISCGALVFWEKNRWLVSELDAHDEVYTRAKLVQCNHLLRWVSNDGVIHEQWCVIEDGTKYLTGEFEDRNFVVTRGDSRIAMTIARNEHTVKFSRENRFLIDDPDANPKLAYLLTKPLKVGSVYNNRGVYKFVLQEVVSTDFDNHELGIADYYKYYPDELLEVDDSEEETDIGDSNEEPNQQQTNITDRKVWI